jgi:hypothetical protein
MTRRDLAKIWSFCAIKTKNSMCKKSTGKMMRFWFRMSVMLLKKLNTVDIMASIPFPDAHDIKYIISDTDVKMA